MSYNPSKEFSDAEKKSYLEQALGKDTADTVLQKYGYYAFDIYRNIIPVADKEGAYPLQKKEISDKLYDQFTKAEMPLDRAVGVINSSRSDFSTLVGAKDVEASAQAYMQQHHPETHSRNASEVLDTSKVSELLNRTIKSDAMAEDLVKKFGDKAYDVALLAVVEPAEMVSQLGIKPNGKFSSSNILSTLVQDSTQIDEAKLDAYLNRDRVSKKNVEYTSVNSNPSQRAEQEGQNGVSSDEKPEKIVQSATIPEKKPEPKDNVPTEGSVEGIQNTVTPEKSPLDDFTFKQGGKTYHLTDLPEGFVIKGDLDLSNLGLKELPDLSKIKVKGSLLLSGNDLTSVDGVLPEVGKNIDLRDNRLTSLKGLPEVVNGDFSCEGNVLTSLEGGPKKVKGAFDCRKNKLETLEGGPKEVGDSYICLGNKLSNLKGSPEVINGQFACGDNRLTTLEGGPKEVRGDFVVSNNALIDLKHAPKSVGCDFIVGDNPLALDPTSSNPLKDIAQQTYVGKEFFCDALFAPNLALEKQQEKLRMYANSDNQTKRDMAQAALLSQSKTHLWPSQEIISSGNTTFDARLSTRSRLKKGPKKVIENEDILAQIVKKNTERLC